MWESSKKIWTFSFQRSLQLCNCCLQVELHDLDIVCMRSCGLLKVLFVLSLAALTVISFAFISICGCVINGEAPVLPASNDAYGCDREFCVNRAEKSRLREHGNDRKSIFEEEQNHSLSKSIYLVSHISCARLSHPKQTNWFNKRWEATFLELGATYIIDMPRRNSSGARNQ